MKLAETFDNDFQDKVLGCLFRVGEFASVAVPYLKGSHFGSAMQSNMAKLAINHYKNYSCCMSKVAFQREVLAKAKSDKEEALIYAKEYIRIAGPEVDMSDYRYVLDNLIDWVKKRRWQQFIEVAITKHLDEGKVPDFDALEKQASAIININSICESKPYDYFDKLNTVERAKKRLADLEDKTGVRTGITELDLKLNGYGWMMKELYIILAPAKRGKTMALLWFANAAALRGKNVVYFTCEVSIHICASRLDAINSGVTFYDLPKSGPKVATTVVRKIPKTGQLKMYEYPTKTLTVSMIEDRLNDLIKNEGFIPDIVLVDYLDLLKPLHSLDNIYQDQGRISEDLRGIAGKFQIPVLTASQINRNGTGKEITTGADVAGSYEKIAVADQIITLSATNEDLKARRLKIHLSESRNNESALLNIETDFARGKFFKRFISAA